MKLVTYLVIFGTFSAICSAIYLPSYIKKCSDKDAKVNDCIKEQTNIFISKVKSGNKKMHIPPLRPLNFNEIIADLGDMHLELTKGAIFGIEQIIIKSVEYDRDAQTVKFVGSTPEFTIKSKYETSGKILILPIQGKGDFDCTLGDVDFTFNTKLANFKRESSEPIKYIDADFDYTYKTGKFGFENLFNGKKELSDPVIKLINEQHQELNKAFKPVLSETLKKLFASAIIEPILKQFSFSDIFVE